MRLRSLRLFAFTALITPAAVVACQGTRFDLAEDPLPSGSDSGTADATMSDAEYAGNDAEESPSVVGVHHARVLHQRWTIDIAEGRQHPRGVVA